MKNISSKSLFYRAFIGLMLAPILLPIFIQMFIYDEKFKVITVGIYVVLSVIVVSQWIMIFRYKNISFDRHHVLVESYFTNTRVLIPLDNVKTIKKSFSFRKNLTRMSYKLVYNADGSDHTIYFFKAIDLYFVEDMEQYVDLKDHNKGVNSQL